MQSGQYPIRSRLIARKNEISGNEATPESGTADQDNTESAGMGEVEEQQDASGSEMTEESGNESEVVQDAQNETENDQESDVTSDSVILDQQSEAEDHQESIVQDAQNQITETETPGVSDEERSEVKEVIKEIVVMQQPETEAIQTVPEPEYLSIDDYLITSILLLSAVLGAVIAFAFLSVINRGL